ncbi:hypothetical protein JCM10213v2_003192 [Rhodosporidiobolus nylandii]
MFGTRSLLSRDSTFSTLSYFRQKRLADAAREQSEDFRSWLLEEAAKSVALAGQAAFNFKRGAIALALEMDREKRFTPEEQKWLLSHVKLHDLKQGFTDYTQRFDSSVLSPHFLPSRMPFSLDTTIAEEHDRVLSHLSHLVRSSPAAIYAVDTAESLTVLKEHTPELQELRLMGMRPKIDKEDRISYYLEIALVQPERAEVGVIVSAALAALKMRNISLDIEEARSRVEQMKEAHEEEARDRQEVRTWLECRDEWEEEMDVLINASANRGLVPSVD